MEKSIPKFILALSLIVLNACNQEALFRKLDPQESGVKFQNRLTPTEDFNILDYIYFYNGGGVAIGDVNGDDLPDLFLSGNQVKNKLYLNKGNLVFEDITERAGVAGFSTWKTGAVMGDVNGDGLLDIYVCAVVGLKHLSGHNELFINNGDNTFSERSADYGLDLETYGSSAAFLDYDVDGDLDIFLLSHAIHTPASFGHASQRNLRTPETGGKLLQNDGGRFVDVSEKAQIYGGINGYGLGVAVSDFNLDGYPDIYVGNDFHEDDYYYINNQNGTFSERAKEAFTSMSKFSMGNDVADINHDGYPDLITLDMLPEDEEVLKRSVDEEDIHILRTRTGKYGYGYQFPRNMLHINQGNGKFAETALMSNVAATDWSWGALFSDFDQDGHQDLFVSNGIPRRPNDLDYIKYVSSERIVNTIGTTKLVDQKALSMMPSGAVRNYIFKGSGNYQFTDKSDVWLPNVKDCSTASSYGDLDNDGDLDLVVNTVDDFPGIYINQTDKRRRYLKIKLRYSKENQLGIGTRIYSYHGGLLQYKEMYTARGFQSSSEPVIHFGYDQAPTVDSIRVIWPDGKTQLVTGVTTNQTLLLTPSGQTGSAKSYSREDPNQLFVAVDEDAIGLTFQHKEDSYTDFDRLKLLPYHQSDKGPATAIGDINGDQLDDVYFGGSKHTPGQFYVQTKTGFALKQVPSVLKDSLKEDVDAVINDFNNDGKPDLFIGTGGADFYGRSSPLLDSYYMSTDSGFHLFEIPDYYENSSCVRTFDFDHDGDTDVFVGNESVSNDFGSAPKSYLLLNENGKFRAHQPEIFENLGMITDAVWDDYNSDGETDLIVTGEWMSPTFLANKNGLFHVDLIVPENVSGLWQSIVPFDIDGDGDRDYLLGNWGLNSKFEASEKFPMKMYYSDFDRDGKSETVLTVAKNGKYYPFDGFDLLASQIPSLRKRFTTYQAFGGKTVEDIFERKQLASSKVYEVNTLASGYLENLNGRFRFAAFPEDLQLAPITAMLRYDFDADGKQEVLLAGNYFGVQPVHGRFGSFQGALLLNQKKIIRGSSLGLDLMNRSVRHLNIISHQNNEYLLITINNDKAQLYKLRK